MLYKRPGKVTTFCNHPGFFLTFWEFATIRRSCSFWGVEAFLGGLQPSGVNLELLGRIAAFWGVWNHPETLQHFGDLGPYLGGLQPPQGVADLGLGFLENPAKAAAGKWLPASPSQKIPQPGWDWILPTLPGAAAPGRALVSPWLGRSRIISPIENNRFPFFPVAVARPGALGSCSWGIWVEMRGEKRQVRARYSCSVYGTGRIHCATPRSVNYHRAINRAEKDPRAPRGRRPARLARFGTSTFLL